MATYAQLADCTDPVVAVEEADLVNADTWVEAQLTARGIDPADVSLPQPLLTQLAAYYALALGATKGQADEGGPLKDKANHYRQLYRDALNGLTRAALGLATPGVGYGSVSVGRG